MSSVPSRSYDFAASVDYWEEAPARRGEPADYSSEAPARRGVLAVLAGLAAAARRSSRES